MHDVWHMLEYLGNTVIFFLAGALTGRVMIRIEFQDYIHLIMIYLASTFSRGFVLFSSRPILTRLQADREELTAADAMVMTWGGIRGAIGLALAIQVQVDKAGNMLSDKDADRVLFYVSGIAAMTLLVNATTCPGLVKWLGITQMPATKRKMLQILNTQLVASTRKTPRSRAVQECVERMLDEVDHHFDVAVGENAETEQIMELSSHMKVEDFLLDEEDYELQHMQVPMVQSENHAATAMVAMRAGHKLVDELTDVRGQFTEMTWDLLELLAEVPQIPLLDQQETMQKLTIVYVPDPAIQRAVNEAFFSLIRARYWNMVDTGVFASFAHEAAKCLSSIDLAFSKPHYDLTDFTFLKPYIVTSFEESQGSLTFEEEQKKEEVNDDEKTCVHELVESSQFMVLLACLIIANTIFIWVEQAFVSEDEPGQTAVGWIVIDVAFNSIFAIEFILKFYDQRVEYFKEGWNVFDFVLVVFGVFGVAVTLFAKQLPSDSQALDSSQARLVRVVQIFRMMRIIRLFRLMRIFRMMRSKIFRSRLSLHTAEHMQKVTILNSFIRAHCESQEAIVKYFGRNNEVNTVELARCILQSQLACYQAMRLAIAEKKQLDPRLLNEVRIAKDAKSLAEELEQFIVDVHQSGVISAPEAESILTPLHHHVHHFSQILTDSQAGRISNILEGMDLDEPIERLAIDERCQGELVQTLKHITNVKSEKNWLEDEDFDELLWKKNGNWKGKKRTHSCIGDEGGASLAVDASIYGNALETVSEGNPQSGPSEDPQPIEEEEAPHEKERKEKKSFRKQRKSMSEPPTEVQPPEFEC